MYIYNWILKSIRIQSAGLRCIGILGFQNLIQGHNYSPSKGDGIHSITMMIWYTSNYTIFPGKTPVWEIKLFYVC